jgi:hypothetical protein
VKAVHRRRRKKEFQDKEPVVMQGTELPTTYEFPYLGAVTCGCGDTEHNITIRMARAIQVFSSLRHLWEDKRLSENLKLNLYQSAVCSVLTYGHEAWTLDRATEKRINGLNSRCLVHITNRTYREEATDPSFDLCAALRSRRLRWLGHILRMDESRLLRQVVTSRGTCNRPPTRRPVPRCP